MAWAAVRLRVHHDTPYTSNETHDTSGGAAHNRLSEINHFLSIAQYNMSVHLLFYPFYLLHLFYFDSKTIRLNTPLQYVLHRRLSY